MIINLEKTDIPVRYTFSVDKDAKQKSKTIHSVHSNGKLNIVYRDYEDIKNAIELVFRVDEYNLKGVKEPLIFNPTKWVFDRENNNTFVRSKQNLRLIFNRYKDKNRKKENLPSMLVAERFFFDTPNGFETSGFSNGPYFPFFINYFDIDIEKDTIIRGLKWLHIPLSIPVMTTFKCREINEKVLDFEGWVSLDESELDNLLTKRIFREKAKPYHFSKDFVIESNIKLKVEAKTGYLSSASFSFQFKTNDEQFTEGMSFTINKTNSTGSFIVTGKPRIIDPY